MINSIQLSFTWNYLNLIFPIYQYIDDTPPPFFSFQNLFIKLTWLISDPSPIPYLHQYLFLENSA